MIAESVSEYMAGRGVHWSGSFSDPPLRALERHWPSGGVTIETGCGASTILISRLSRKHTVFTIDDRDQDNSSVQFATEAPLYRQEVVEFVFGPTQRTLPPFSFAEQIDGALIDGPHAYPFPELEYYFIYPHLKTGALLIIDDVHIPTLFNLYRFLREERMFEFLEKSASTAFFRRTDTPTFSPLGDGWHAQEFNRRRFPVEGRDERIARYFPAWLTHLFPPSIRTAIKNRLLKSQT